MNFEKPLIGALLVDSSAIESVKVKLNPSQFMNTDCSEIYRAICSLHDKGESTDVLSVSDEVSRDKYHTGPNVLNLISECYESCPSAINAESYAERVLDAHKRRLVSTLANIAETADNGAQAVDEALKQLTEINNSETNSQRHINDALTSVIERTERIFSGEGEDWIRTGLIDLDRQIDGFANGGLYILGARPSMGKTALALNFVNEAIFKDIPTIFFTMEMPDHELAYRQVCACASLNTKSQKDMQDEDWPKLTAGFTMLKDKPLIIDDGAGYTVDYLKNAIRTHAAKTEKSFYVIDYLQLIRIKGDNRVTGIGEITRELKLLAKSIDRPILLLSQLNRGLEQRNDKRPIMSDLRESGEIEQDADVIIFIYRDEIYNEDSPDAGIAELLVRKNRQGETGVIRVASNLKYSRFDNLNLNRG